jgi:hypothetical protein
MVYRSSAQNVFSQMVGQSAHIPLSAGSKDTFAMTFSQHRVGGIPQEVAMGIYRSCRVESRIRFSY